MVVSVADGLSAIRCHSSRCSILVVHNSTLTHAIFPLLYKVGAIWVDGKLWSMVFVIMVELIIDHSITAIYFDNSALHVI